MTRCVCRCGAGAEGALALYPLYTYLYHPARPGVPFVPPTRPPAACKCSGAEQASLYRILILSLFLFPVRRYPSVCGGGASRVAGEGRCSSFAVGGEACL